MHEPTLDEARKWNEAYEKGYSLGYENGRNEQKSAEWSEDIIRKAVKEVGLTQHQIDWFKTNVLPPKQGWSEEDEEHLDSIIESYKELLKDYKACHDIDYIPYNSDTVIRNVVDDVNFLKSLRPQPKSIISDTDKSNLKDAPSIIRKSNHPFKENIALIIEKYL